MRKAIFTILCMAALATALFFAPAPAWAQATSRVSGTVSDKSGALIPAATVTLTNEATNVSLTTSTTSAGTYVFDGIVPGTYTVTIEKTGFAPFSSTGNVLTIAQPMVVNATLQVGSVSEKVVVSAGAELVQTETSGDLGALINQQALTTLPIVGARGRSPLDLLELTPGVVDGGPMNSTGANIQGGGVSVDGSRDRAWNYTLDGIDINEDSAPGSNFSPLRTNPDSISGFRVINSNADAAYGQTSGAQVILNTRSGTNQFHGGGFWFYQTPGLNANDPGNKEQNPPLPRPQFVQNILGFDVGGPIFKNKTFFFVNVQGLHTSQSFGETSLVYTKSARAGLIRYIQNPANCGTNCPQNEPAGSAGAVVDTSGNPLPGETIDSYNIAANDPEALGLDSSIQKFLGLTPLPNNFTVGDGLNTAGFTWLAPEFEKQIDFTVRIDHQINDKNSIFGRWAHGHQNTIADIVNGGLQPFPTAPPVVDTFRQPRNLALEWRYTPNSAITNQVIAGMNRFIFNFANPDSHFLSNPPFIFEGDAVLGFLDDSLASPLQNYVGNLRALTTFQLVDNLSYVRGQHAFRFGTNLKYERHIDNRGSIGPFDAQPLMFFDPTVRPVPSTFNLPANINPGNDLITLKAAVNNLLGRYSEIQQGLVAANNGNQYAPAGAHLSDDFRMPEYDFYGQDTWKFRPNLTIDAGLRWEVRLSPRVGRNFLLHPNQTVAFNAPGADNLSWVSGPFYKNALHDFGPSIGVAWDPFKDGKSSVRANYRIAYDSMNTFVLSSAVFQGIPGETFAVDQRFNAATGQRVSQGIPVLTSGGVTPVQQRMPASFSTSANTVVNPHWTPPQVNEWSLSLERQVGNNSLVELSYIGHHAVHLFGAYDANQAQINTNGFLAAFNTVAAGGDSPLIDQLLANDPTRPSTETGSQWMRDSNSAYQSALSRGSVAEDAAIIGQATDASGNPLPVSAGLSPTFFFLYPQYAGGLDVLDSRDWSWYHGLQATYRGRFEALTYQLNYTYSKSEDTRSFDPTFARVVGGGSTFGSSSTPFENANPALNYAPSDFDRTHVFQGIWTYKIPFGAERKWGSNWGPLLNHLVSGWEISGDTVIETGRPTTFYSSANTTSSIVQTPASYCSGCSPFLHVQRVTPDPTMPKVTILTYFPTNSQFSTPAPGQLSNVGRNFFRLPGYSVVNMSLGKVTQIAERYSLELRVEMQNAFNSVHYEQPASGHIGSGVFGIVDFSTVENFGLAPGSNPRTVQLSAKFNF